MQNVWQRHLFDEIINSVLADGNEPTSIDVPAEPADDHKRERLIALAAGGTIQEYLRKEYSRDQLEGYKQRTTDKLYACYEARLGALMTKH